MITLENLKKNNKIHLNELNNVSRILFNSFIIRKQYKSSYSLVNQEELIDNFSELLVKYIELGVVNTRKQKLELINFIEKLNLQKELLELAQGKTNISDIKLAAQRLGKKAQSAFETK